jgi:tRNA (guanine37-N1)-methyltransferase
VRIVVITLFPEIFSQTLKMGVVGQAIESGLIKVRYINPRDFTKDVHKTVDDRPFGGGDGMIMLCEPLALAMGTLGDRQHLHTIYLSPQGIPFNHKRAVELSCEPKELVLVCGRYGGIDQRFINQYVDEEISLGDFVLSGGEVPALALIDAVARQKRGVLGHQHSAIQDSFANGLLEAPQYTRPRDWRGYQVPEALMSGHHVKINAFRECLGYLVSFKKRPDLLNPFKKQFKNEKLRKKFLQQLFEIEGLSESELLSLALSKELIYSFKEKILGNVMQSGDCNE